MTSPWEAALRRPADLSDRAAVDWFAAIADLLLNRTAWVIAGRPHRITECEFYYRGPAHADPFTHGDPVQVHNGRWYFHRTGGIYRGGTFKGLDMTFGDPTARGGILFRGIESDDGGLLDGPSLLVDRILHLCGAASVGEMDRRIGARLAWDRSSPISFEVVGDRGLEILPCARVGLSLRRATPGTRMPAYLTRPYRFLTEPRRIAKGKPQMVLGLHRLGRRPEEIREVTRSPTRSVAAYLEEYAAGLREGQFEDYFGAEIGPRQLARLHGIADRASGAA